MPTGTRVTVFQRIYEVFLVLGTLVGVVVIAYMLHKAYKYRDGAHRGEDEMDRPEVGELPRGGGGGRKLFLSFSISAVIVISLIIWTYGTLLYVESPDPGEDAIEVKVTGYQFFWEFEYTGVPGHENGVSTQGELRVPADTMIQIRVTSGDVFHNFGVPGLRVKADAIPGQETRTWFEADRTGTYPAQCYELCGSGHSHMTADVVVVGDEEFDSWYSNQVQEQ